MAVKKSNFQAGDLVFYLKDDQLKTSPPFMMWHGVESNGNPKMDWHPCKWMLGDMAIVLETHASVGKENIFLKLLKTDGGVGWTLSSWCKK